MGKISRNIFALVRGQIVNISAFSKPDCSIGQKLRCFRMASVRLYKGCSCRIGDGVKLNTNVTVSVQPGGSLQIGNKVGIGPNSMVVCHKHIRIGNGVMIGPGVCIYDHDHQFSKADGIKPFEYTYGDIDIGDNCWIGAGCIILKGTTIGEGCVIGAGSVLKGEYPPHSLVTMKRECEVREIR